MTDGPLAGIRVIESSMLGPGAITTHLADLGADVIKVESPAGDYIRQMSWPIIEGESLLHWHISRGKRSIVLDLKTPEGIDTYKELVGRRPRRGRGHARRRPRTAGLGYDVLREINPRIVFCTISGYGATGPYKNLPSHGIAYDTWAGLVKPDYDEEGYPFIPEHPSVGIHAGPVFGALGILAGVVQAERTGEGCQLEIAQSDAAAAMDWLRSETWKAYERPESEVTGNPADDYERRAPGTAGMKGGVRYSIYESSRRPRHLHGLRAGLLAELLPCGGPARAVRALAGQHVRRPRPGQPGDAGRAGRRSSGAARPSTGCTFGDEHNVPIAPVHTPQTIADDPQFQARLGFLPASEHGADLLPTPIKLVGDELPAAAQGADGGPAHRRDPARGARQVRRRDRRTPSAAGAAT